jgi:ATP-binding cassette subfamily F protein 3
VSAFDGDLDDYQRWLKTRGKATQPVSEVKKSPPPRPVKSATTSKPKREATLRRELQQLEEKLERLQAERTQIDAKLAESDLYDRERAADLRQLTERRAQLSLETEALEEQWLEAGAALEGAEQ